VNYQHSPLKYELCREAVSFLHCTVYPLPFQGFSKWVTLSGDDLLDKSNRILINLRSLVPCEVDAQVNIGEYLVITSGFARGFDKKRTKHG